MHRAITLGSVLATLWSGALGAQGTAPWQEPPSDTTALTVDEARRLALHQNPALLADLQRLGAAAADLRTAQTYPFNPALEIEAPGSFTDRTDDRYEIRLGQDIEWAGQRGLRIDAAEAGVTAAQAGALDDVRVVLADVERTWFSLASAGRRLAVATDIRMLNDRLLDAVRVQLAEGEVSLLQANLLEIEAARARARVLAAHREVVEAELALIRLTGLPASSTVRAVGIDSVDSNWGSSASLPELSLFALDHRPDLLAARAGVDRAESLRSLATREALPNVRISGIADREGTGAPTRFGLALTVPVPLFDRNQGPRARRVVEANGAAMTVEATELRVRTEVADAYRAWQAAGQEVGLFERGVVAPARENQQLLETAYQEGKLDLATLLLLRNQLLDAEMGYWDAWERQHHAEVALRSATAILLADIDLDLLETSR
ncbi:TolC family protein [Gaopeijia maritima]|uniref:TolC family protein n=1 Tax=Gaopeijia maritima TaxID=3119007 RepID=UPI00326C98F8